MITREHRNQILAAMGFAIPIILGALSASWVISTQISDLSSRVTALEHDQLHTAGDVRRIELNAAEHDAREAAADDRMAETVAYLRATWDMIKDQQRFRPGRFSH
jgi:hypothetical protein